MFEIEAGSRVREGDLSLSGRLTAGPKTVRLAYHQRLLLRTRGYRTSRERPSRPAGGTQFRGSGRVRAVSSRSCRQGVARRSKRRQLRVVVRGRWRKCPSRYPPREATRSRSWPGPVTAGDELPRLSVVVEECAEAPVRRRIPKQACRAVRQAARGSGHALTPRTWKRRTGSSSRCWSRGAHQRTTGSGGGTATAVSQLNFFEGLLDDVVVEREDAGKWVAVVRASTGIVSTTS